MFTKQMSSIAKLIDWLSFKYNVLFCVSAGNISDDITFNLSLSEFENLSKEERSILTLKKYPSGVMRIANIIKRK